METFLFFALSFAALIVIVLIVSKGSEESRQNEAIRKQTQELEDQKRLKKLLHLEKEKQKKEELERIERDKQFKKQVEIIRLEKQLAAKKAEEDKLEEEKRQRQEQLTKKRLREEEEKKLIIFQEHLNTLTSCLPFYVSNTPPSDEYKQQDQKNWDDVVDHIKNKDQTKATLYFVKIRSLLDDNDYFKIGITTKGVEERFEKSTQVELLEVIEEFHTTLYKAAFLEYYFLKEFRLFDGLSNTLDDIKPLAKFSGYTEVVRSNSTNKIKTFFDKLDVYNTID